MYKICHIGKRKYLALITNGLVLCQNMNTKTHRFKIKLRV